jgi:hypothetical protein
VLHSRNHVEADEALGIAELAVVLRRAIRVCPRADPLEPLVKNVPLFVAFQHAVLHDVAMSERLKV